MRVGHEFSLGKSSWNSISALLQSLLSFLPRKHFKALIHATFMDKAVLECIVILMVNLIWEVLLINVLFSSKIISTVPFSGFCYVCFLLLCCVASLAQLSADVILHWYWLWDISSPQRFLFEWVTTNVDVVHECH